MNTIIYLYHSREITEFITEKWQEEDYCLIRLGIPCLLWKNLKEMDDKEQAVSGTYQPKSGESREIDSVPDRTKRQARKRRRWFLGRKGRKARERSERQAGEQSEHPNQPDETELEKKRLQSRIIEQMEELRELQIALCLLGNNPYWTYCVYEDYLREKIDTECWRTYWAIPEFEDYHEYMWVGKLMRNAVPGQYVILGYADCVSKVLCENASKMRSVKWFLEEKQLTGEVQDFIEDFYEEYGLAVEVRPVREAWVRLRPASTVPVNVLDFTGEEKLSAGEVADGSIWLDMDSLDGKNRRMEAGNMQISYFSLKKLWKQRQKEAFCLDTLNKNGYNT